MADRPIALIDQPDRVRLALSPLRRQLLERLQTPASASQIAAELTIGRQRVNYHLRALERAGLLELVEERQRRGCTERVLVTRAKLFVVDPTVVNPAESTPGRASSCSSRSRSAKLTLAGSCVLARSAGTTRGSLTKAVAGRAPSSSCRMTRAPRRPVSKTSMCGAV